MSASKKQLPAKDPRDELIVQGNDLIRHIRFQLTALEQNLLYFCMSKVRPTDTDFMKISFTVEEFCHACHMEVGKPGGINYRRIKAAIRSIADKSAWVEYENGYERLTRWFDDIWIKQDSGELAILLSQTMKPYLIGLIKRASFEGVGYTQTALLTYLALQSKYGKRLYEILKSYLYSRGSTEKLYRLTFQEYSLDEIKQLLNAGHYGRWQDFRRYALDVAVAEIEKVTDIHVSYKEIKTGRKITGVHFSFQHKKDADRWGAEMLARKILDSPKRLPRGTASDAAKPV